MVPAVRALPRICPVCGRVNSANALLFRARFLEGPLGDGYDVVICPTCGAGFADGIPSQQELDRYYAEQSKYTYDARDGEEAFHDRQRFELIVEQVGPALTSLDAHVVDLGCATGGLLSILAQRGFRNLVGVDPSPACAEAAQRLHRIDVKTATLSGFAKWKEQFDLIFLVGVLEHLRDVDKALDGIGRRLRASSGLLYIAVPDVEGLADCHNAPYQQFSMEHINFFSVQSLELLLRRRGFRRLRTWQKIIEWREGITEPMLSGLFQLEMESPRRELTPDLVSRDSITEPSLRRYLAASAVADANVREKIATLVRGGRPIFVWGAGALARRLLLSTVLAEGNIIAFIDSDRNLQGKKLAGKEIVDPRTLRNRKEAILVCSVAFEREIVRVIREQLDLSNELITLS
jgi:SAM-dependent methyltransferase